MRCLIVLCAHDGIVSHYTGVGTVCQGYIKSIRDYAARSGEEITLQLVTPRYNQDSFGYSERAALSSKAIAESLGGSVAMIENGSDGAVNYGTPEHWRTLCKNTAAYIRGLDTSGYDKVVVMYNDTPFACLGDYLNDTDLWQYWIPHSTVKIHKVDSALDKAQSDYFQERLEWEMGAVDGINARDRSYLAVIGEYIREHMINEYGALASKCVALTNGVFAGEAGAHDANNMSTGVKSPLVDAIDPRKTIILSFARAEAYKNLEYTIKLGAHFDADEYQTIVIAQSYYPTQPILAEYARIRDAHNPGAMLFIDPPFDLPKQILALKNKKVVVVPSHAETMGIIVNEIRYMNDPNCIVVANDVDGLNEQITDGYDGVLITADDYHLQDSARKVRGAMRDDMRSKIVQNGYDTVTKQYDLGRNVECFLNEICKKGSV